jgi:NADH dehydrogenase subunit 5 C-terminus
MDFGYFISFKTIDRGFIELSGPFGLAKIIPSCSKVIATIQTGQLTHYIFFMVIGVLLLLSFVIPNSLFDLQFNSSLVGICLILLFFV